MSSMFDQIRQAAVQQNIQLDDTAVNRVAGTLRFAGVAALDTALVQEVERQQREAAAVVEAGTFGGIDASLKSGKCPRCGKAMKEVLLSDFSPALYCTGECRITLWKQDDEDK